VIALTTEQQPRRACVEKVVRCDAVVSCALDRDAPYRRESSVVPGEGPDPARTRRFVRGPSHETRFQFVQRIGDAYGLVLVLILTTFVVTMTLPPQGWVGRVAAVAIAGLTAIIALTSSDVPLGRVRFAAGAALAAVIATALGRVLSSDALVGAAFVVDSLLLAVAAVTILRRVVPSAMVDFRTILGAISVFTLLGLLFGFLFLALGRLVAGDVFAGVSHAQARDYLFFSYTTLTTTGYGNLVPAGDIGQILSVFEMLTGQIFLVTLVAGLVSLWRPGARAAEAADEQPLPPRGEHTPLKS
jgi:Ion channel